MNDFDDDFLDAVNSPDLDFAIDDQMDTADGNFVRCLCSGEHIPASRAFRLGCDQPGGCSELRDSMDGLWP